MIQHRLMTNEKAMKTNILMQPNVSLFSTWIMNQYGFNSAAFRPVDMYFLELMGIDFDPDSIPLQAGSFVNVYHNHILNLHKTVNIIHQLKMNKEWANIQAKHEYELERLIQLQQTKKGSPASRLRQSLQNLISPEVEKTPSVFSTDITTFSTAHTNIADFQSPVWLTEPTENSTNLSFLDSVISNIKNRSELYDNRILSQSYSLLEAYINKGSYSDTSDVYVKYSKRSQHTAKHLNLPLYHIRGMGTQIHSQLQHLLISNQSLIQLQDVDTSTAYLRQNSIQNQVHSNNSVFNRQFFKSSSQSISPIRFDDKSERLVNASHEQLRTQGQDDSSDHQSPLILVNTQLNNTISTSDSIVAVRQEKQLNHFDQLIKTNINRKTIYAHEYDLTLIENEFGNSLNQSSRFNSNAEFTSLEKHSNMSHNNLLLNDRHQSLRQVNTVFNLNIGAFQWQQWMTSMHKHLHNGQNQPEFIPALSDKSILRLEQISTGTYKWNQYQRTETLLHHQADSVFASLNRQVNKPDESITVVNRSIETLVNAKPIVSAASYQIEVSPSQSSEIVAINKAPLNINFLRRSLYSQFIDSVLESAHVYKTVFNRNAFERSVTQEAFEHAIDLSSVFSFSHLNTFTKSDYIKAMSELAEASLGKEWLKLVTASESIPVTLDSFLNAYQLVDASWNQNTVKSLSKTMLLDLSQNALDSYALNYSSNWNPSFTKLDLRNVNQFEHDLSLALQNAFTAFEKTMGSTETGYTSLNTQVSAEHKNEVTMTSSLARPLNASLKLPVYASINAAASTTVNTDIRFAQVTWDQYLENTFNQAQWIQNRVLHSSETKRDLFTNNSITRKDLYSTESYIESSKESSIREHLQLYVNTDITQTIEHIKLSLPGILRAIRKENYEEIEGPHGKKGKKKSLHTKSRKSQHTLIKRVLKEKQDKLSSSMIRSFEHILLQKLQTEILDKYLEQSRDQSHLLQSTTIKQITTELWERMQKMLTTELHDVVSRSIHDSAISHNNKQHIIDTALKLTLVQLNTTFSEQSIEQVFQRLEEETTSHQKHFMNESSSVSTMNLTDTTSIHTDIQTDIQTDTLTSFLQLNHLSRLNQGNELTQRHQLHQGNQFEQDPQKYNLNEMNRLSHLSHIKQLNKLDKLNKLNKLNLINQHSISNLQKQLQANTQKTLTHTAQQKSKEELESSVSIGITTNTNLVESKMVNTFKQDRLNNLGLIHATALLNFSSMITQTNQRSILSTSQKKLRSDSWTSQSRQLTSIKEKLENETLENETLEKDKLYQEHILSKFNQETQPILNQLDIIEAQMVEHLKTLSTASVKEELIASHNQSATLENINTHTISNLVSAPLISAPYEALIHSKLNLVFTDDSMLQNGLNSELSTLTEDVEHRIINLESRTKDIESNIVDTQLSSLTLEPVISTHTTKISKDILGHVQKQTQQEVSEQIHNRVKTTLHRNINTLEELDKTNTIASLVVQTVDELESKTFRPIRMNYAKQAAQLAPKLDSKPPERPKEVHEVPDMDKVQPAQDIMQARLPDTTLPTMQPVDVDAIFEKIYNKFEKRIAFEKRRRGL